MDDLSFATAPSAKLNGKHVLIFGGTSGIGLATARQAKAAGAVVTVVGSDPARTQKAATEHGFSDWRAADIADPDAIGPALSSIGTVDHLVLLAGSFIVGTLYDTDIALFRRAFDERLWAAVHILRTLGDRLAADASITFVSGVAADRPSGNGTAIIAAASKAVETLGRGLAQELAPRRVNTISPGPIDTPMLSKALGEGRDAFVAGLKKQLPAGRLGTADEAGNAIIFLMSNGFMTGATINIDGGMILTS
ncbi:SDR family oxidoreductase [Devosia sp. 919]|uniref:SDR family oxidoreductase n=1 Tax=Devosia sp. 919 TaxID=2726065 RepID=UPI001557624D|nr:SDR family oxidoreductase [Devosia sp. 919]